MKEHSLSSVTEELRRYGPKDQDLVYNAFRGNGTSRAVAICLFLLLALAGPIFAQPPVQFMAETEAERVLPRQSFEVSYVLENAEGSRFAAPDFTPFEVLRGPLTSSSLQIINGKRSSSVTYSFVLAAPQAGQYTLPPARISVQGETLSTLPLTIEVVPGSPSSAGARELFARYEPSTDSPYIGEAVMLDLVLYSQRPVQNVYKRNEPDRSAWYSMSFPVRPPVKKTILQGKPYRRQVLNRELLFAQKSGSVALDPMYLQVDLEKEDGRDRRFSFFRSYDRKELFVPDTSLYVQALPQPAPENFSGLVGETQIRGQLQTGQIGRGEAAEYSLRLESYSDPNIVQPPRLIVDGAEVLKPTLSFEGKEDDSFGRKYIYVYDYLVIPDTLGRHRMYPQITYFNTKKDKYDTLTSSTAELWVTEKSVAAQRRPDTSSASQARSTEEQEEGTGGFRWWWLTAPFLVAVLWLVFRFQKNKKSSADPSDKLDRQWAQLLKQDRPDPRELRECLNALSERDEKAEVSTEDWQQYLKDLDYLVFSPSADETEWDRILGEWRARLQR